MTIHVAGGVAASGIIISNSFPTKQLEVIDATITAHTPDGTSANGIFMSVGQDVILDGVTIKSNGFGASFFGFELDGVAHHLNVLRSNIFGQTTGLNAAEMHTQVESSLISSPTLALRVEDLVFAASSSQISGPIHRIPNATLTCTRVFDGQLAQRPANCGAIDSTQ